MSKRVYFISGARSDYDLMSPVLEELKNSKEVDASLVLCAAHLSPFHGYNIEIVQNEGHHISGTIESLLSSESWEGRSLSFANLHEGLTRLLARDMPDMIFVAGDREEALAGALAACFLRIPVAHSHGGDRCLASDIDEVLRPAISKLANLHFVATHEHAERLEKMGEQRNSIKMTGAASLTRLRKPTVISISQLYEKYGLSQAQSHFLVIHHPSPTLGLEQGAMEIRELLSGVLSLELPVFCSYPNADPGNMSMRQVIDELKSEHDNLHAYHNLPQDEFLVLYKNASAIVGNSSSIVTESGYLKVPGILVGRRQELRVAGDNVLRVPAKADLVKSACETVLTDCDFLDVVKKGVSPYGDESAAACIARHIEEASFESEDLLKTMAY